VAAFWRSLAVALELRVRNMAVNSNCTACAWTVMEFCSMCRDTQQLLRFLASHHVVLGDFWCERCGQPCRVDLTRFSFRCDRRHVRRDSRGRRLAWRCNFNRTLFFGTWFSAVHLYINTVCQLNCLWLNLPYPRQQMMVTELGVSKQTVVDWSFCREVCMFFGGKMLTVSRWSWCCC